jgi:hypothetical protein
MFHLITPQQISLRRGIGWKTENRRVLRSLGEGGRQKKEVRKSSASCEGRAGRASPACRLPCRIAEC